jgi:hypothetical protein
MSEFQTVQVIFIVTLVMTLISYFFIFMFAMQAKRLRKKYVKLVEGSDVPSLEQIILQLQKQIVELKETQKIQEFELLQLQEKLKHMKSKLYIHRYSAFSNEFYGLSYSIALLDEFHNGIVITSLYNREQSYTYAKPIVEGQSHYQLSPEEKEAVLRAIHESPSAPN